MNKQAKIEWDYRNEIHKKIAPATLLLSEPFMKDPAFSRSVCLVINHEKLQGTFGLIINKPMDTYLSKIIKDIKKDWKIFYGGPVDPEYLFYIHNNKDIKNAIKVSENLYWNGDFEEIKDKINKGEIKENDIRFILGYSGWDSGQLRREIIENSWIISNDTQKFVFSNYKTLWKNILKDMNGIYKTFANFPLDPNLN